MESRGIEDLKSAGIDVHENSAEEIAEFKKLVQPLYTEVVSENVAKEFIKAAEANQ